MEGRQHEIILKPLHIGAKDLLRGIGAVYTGYVDIMKKHPFFKGHELRYVVLSQACVYIYHNRHSKAPDIAYSILEFEKAGVYHDDDEDYCFSLKLKEDSRHAHSIKDKSRQLVFACDRRDVRDEWVSNLQTCMLLFNNPYADADGVVKDDKTEQSKDSGKTVFLKSPRNENAIEYQNTTDLVGLPPAVPPRPVLRESIGSFDSDENEECDDTDTQALIETDDKDEKEDPKPAGEELTDNSGIIEDIVGALKNKGLLNKHNEVYGELRKHPDGTYVVLPVEAPASTELSYKKIAELFVSVLGTCKSYSIYEQDGRVSLYPTFEVHFSDITEMIGHYKENILDSTMLTDDLSAQFTDPVKVNELVSV